MNSVMTVTRSIMMGVLDVCLMMDGLAKGFHLQCVPIQYVLVTQSIIFLVPTELLAAPG